MEEQITTVDVQCLTLAFQLIQNAQQTARSIAVQMIYIVQWGLIPKDVKVLDGVSRMIQLQSAKAHARSSALMVNIPAQLELTPEDATCQMFAL